MAEQVIHRGSAGGLAGQKHRRVFQNVAQTNIRKIAPHPRAQRSTEQLGQQHHMSHGRFVNEVRKRTKGGVQKAIDREMVGLRSDLQILADFCSRARLDGFKKLRNLLDTTVDIHGLETRRKHPVRGGELAQIQQLLRGGAELLEEMLKGLGHQVPTGAGVPRKTLIFKQAGAATDGVIFLVHSRLEPLARQKGRAGKTRDTPADDHSFLCRLRAICSWIPRDVILPPRS